jgi:hypothetical protein
MLSARVVRLASAEQALLVMLVAFALTVIGTRWFLALTGFPKIGGGDLHIAHALWGGALLFIGSLLPLIWSGRTIHLSAAALSGAGFGLFVDEVGKFITTGNDYFYPAAAPIIYATFLLSVLVYLWVRRSGPNDETRPNDPQATYPMAETRDRASGTSLVSRTTTWWSVRRDRWRGRRGVRIVVISALLIAGFGSVAGLIFFSLIVIFVVPASDIPLLNLIIAHVVGDGVSGALMLTGAVLLIIGRRRRGVAFASAGLLVALSLSDLLSFYLRQFDSIVVVLFHFGLFLAVRWLMPADERQPIPGYRS